MLKNVICVIMSARWRYLPFVFFHCGVNCQGGVWGQNAKTWTIGFNEWYFSKKISGKWLRNDEMSQKVVKRLVLVWRSVVNWDGAACRIGWLKHKPIDLNYIFNRRYLENVLGMMRGMLKGDVIAEHSGQNWHGVSLNVCLRKREPLDLIYDF